MKKGVLIIKASCLQTCLQP